MRFLMLNWRDPKDPSAGGAERVSLAYMEALRDRGHEVAWFSNAFPGCTAEEHLNGIHYARGGGKGTSIVKARAWYRRQPKFDLVIDQHHGIPWFAPWWCGTQCIAYIHEVLGPIWKVFYPQPIAALGQLQERWTHWAYRNVPFWTVSESTRTGLVAHGVHDVTVIPNGTDVVAIPSLPPKPMESPIRLAVVSRLAPNKRIDHVIRALGVLTSMKIVATLEIIGTGEDEQKLRELAAALGLGGQISFAGRLNEQDKNAHLLHAHLLVHTTVREGWGLNVIEANCMGTPAVVYPVGGLVDSTVHGVTGLVAKAESPQSVADSIASLVRSPVEYDRLRLQAWERAKTFHWTHVLKLGCDYLEKQAKTRGTA